MQSAVDSLAEENAEMRERIAQLRDVVALQNEEREQMDVKLREENAARSAALMVFMRVHAEEARLKTELDKVVSRAAAAWTRIGELQEEDAEWVRQIESHKAADERSQVACKRHAERVARMEKRRMLPAALIQQEMAHLVDKLRRHDDQCAMVQAKEAERAHLAAVTRMNEDMQAAALSIETAVTIELTAEIATEALSLCEENNTESLEAAAAMPRPASGESIDKKIERAIIIALTSQPANATEIWNWLQSAISDDFDGLCVEQALSELKASFVICTLRTTEFEPMTSQLPVSCVRHPQQTAQ